MNIERKRTQDDTIFTTLIRLFHRTRTIHRRAPCDDEQFWDFEFNSISSVAVIYHICATKQDP